MSFLVVIAPDRAVVFGVPKNLKLFKLLDIPRLVSILENPLRWSIIWLYMNRGFVLDAL